MRALIQRVSSGKVSVAGKLRSAINKGYVVLLGVKIGDGEKEAQILAEKTVNLRVMSDENDKMNLSIKDVDGEILVISQFTLYVVTSRGRRPSFIKAAQNDIAQKLYLSFIGHLKKLGVKRVVTGEFGTYMSVTIVNDGPVTIMLDTEEL